MQKLKLRDVDVLHDILKKTSACGNDTEGQGKSSGGSHVHAFANEANSLGQRNGTHAHADDVGSSGGKAEKKKKEEKEREEKAQ